MITFKNVSKKYKNRTVLDNISFEINDNEIVVLIGASGCGKTTSLKMINALIRPTKGEIYIDGENIKDKDPIALRRNIGYVIQQTGLFPHMTIRENLEIIATLEKHNQEEVSKKTTELMDMVGLDDLSFLDRYPSQLSGGQQQRIGVARAFSCDPNIILMDEPFSALDPITRNQLQEELIEIQSKMRKTIVFVTHDMDEAIKIADRICVMQDGQIAQYDTPEQILKKPANDFVAEFIGEGRIWSAPELILAKDIMITQVVKGIGDMSIDRCLRRMRSRNVNSLIIVDKEGKVEGVLSAKEARSILDKTQPVRDVLASEFIFARLDDPMVELLPVVNLEDIHSVPVIDENNILRGLITQSSLMTTLSEPYVEEISLEFGEVDDND